MELPYDGRKFAVKSIKSINRAAINTCDSLSHSLQIHFPLPCCLGKIAPTHVEKAPSIQKFGGTHLEANEYHEAMKDPDAVIIDVRNAYESAIGGFRPPPTGAKLIDPKMRNSIEFPKWLGAKETQNELNGKKVLMYCTGGIRCERASALLNQMKAANPDLKPKGVYHCRGGIERYVKTFPGGGFWKGNNYLFDKRMEQAPSFVQEPTNTSTTTVATNTTTESDSSGTVGAKCCLCRAPWSIYRGQFHCASPTGVCGVPVIVCQQCEHAAREHPERLVCELCRRGYRAPSNAPDLVGMKRRADKIAQEESSIKESLSTNTVAVTDKSVVKKRPKTYYYDRLFLRRLPLTVTATKIKKALSEDVLYIHWLVDKSSHKGFYGSCVVVLSGGADATERILSKSQNSSWATPRPIIRIDKKRIKVARVFCKESDVDWVSVGLKSIEYPPIGTHG